MDFLVNDIVDDETIRASVSRLNEDIFSSLNDEQQTELTRAMHWYQTASLKDAVLDLGQQVPNLLIPLPDQTNSRLYDILRNGPAIFVFFRSDWCAYCNYHIDILRKALPAFQSACTRMFAVTPERNFSRSDWYRYNSAGFDVVVDSAMEIVNAFNVGYAVPDFVADFLNSVGIEPYDAEVEWRLPLTGAFIIDQGAKVAWRHVEQDYRYRATPQQLLDGLANLHNAKPLAS